MDKDIKLQMPKSVSEIINILKDNNYESFMVGGCVRDSILRMTPNDWDICTSALPEEIMECFKDYGVIETGLKHGTVTVMIDGVGYEITTYRIDGQYSDNRHPDSVVFTDDIVKDLARRDFAQNAMAYNDEVGLVDPFGGREDLKNHIIKCVGTPDERFKEDALRIMRALRFASTYSCSIEENTSKSMIKNKSLLKNIATERINSELCKLLKGKNAKNILLEYKEIIGEIIPEIIPCFDFSQKSKYHSYDVYEHMVVAMDNYKKSGGKDPFVIFSLFLHDIGKPQSRTEDERGYHFYGHQKISYVISKEILTRMKFDNFSSNIISELILNHDAEIFASKKSIKRWLCNMGENQFRRLLEIKKADLLAHSPAGIEGKKENIKEICEIFEEIIAEKECFSLKDLAINGKDVIEAGVKEGPEVGKMLKKILDAVIDGELENDKEKIKEKIKKEIRSSIYKEEDYER